MQEDLFLLRQDGGIFLIQIREEIIKGGADKNAVWSVNTEKTYHETKTEEKKQ